MMTMGRPHGRSFPRKAVADLNMRSLRERLPQAAEQFSRANLWLYAASGTYYLFFSLGPLAVLVLGLLPYMPFTEQELSDALLRYMPEPFQELVHSLVGGVYAGSAAALGIGAVTELWSAGNFLSLLMRGVGQIYDGESRDGYLHRRLLGALYTGVLLVLILTNTALLLGGERLLYASGALQRHAGLWTALLRLRWLFFLAAVTAVVALLYRHVPRRQLRFRRQLPGAAFAAVAWLAFSQLYSWAVERFRFFSVYGGLAIVIISLFWMYCSLYLLFLGAWLNAQRENMA